MPIRITCPSCSATLSVKDEYAERAVKCPKCSGVIPASQPPAPAPAAPPTPAKAAPVAPPPPERAPFEALDEPAPARASGKPVRSKRADGDDDRPAKRERRDDEDDGRPVKRRRHDGDEPDRAGRGKRAEGGSNAALIVGIVCATLLTCCGSVGFGVYWFMVKTKEAVVETLDKAKEALENSNFLVSQRSYGELKVGTTTRAQAEATLSKGKTATADDLRKAFGADQKKIDAWTPKANQSRVVYWRNGDDYILAAFHPNAEDQGRVQAKEWRPKNGAPTSAGELDDAKFLQQYPPIGPTTEVRAEDLAKQTDDDAPAARDKYQNKTFILSGKLLRISARGNTLEVVLEGAAKGQLKEITCALRAGQAPFSYGRGQRIKVSGKCTGFGLDEFADGTLSGAAAPDPSVQVSAATLIADYANPGTADPKYKNKDLTISGARIERVENGRIVITTVGKNDDRKITVAFDTDLKSQFPYLRAGATIKIKGKCTGLTDADIDVEDAWFTQ
ncbi:OB-fold protein [Frigoriglobus tundricola]|uniref:Uncharacterized protein n=1 Tax=Frigoriglobus tundricola TaxID=2774151 RepID=A0A6M5YRW5_9BACT|nr:MJ0042-type zinc finger domain-containing protein [Frigoriglobus tundricola]QJW96827.1 hypothetical protein FTUN_4387 [Frigoriglobus tundricola]